MAGQIPHMAPVPQIGIFTDYCVRGPNPEVLVLREKVMSLSGDSFEIKLMNGQPIFRVQGKVMSISDRKSVYDMANNHLFDIVKEHFHIHSTYACEDPKGNKFFEVKSGFKRGFPILCICLFDTFLLTMPFSSGLKCQGHLY